MRYTALFGANAKGGVRTMTEQGLVVEGADQATLVISAGTSWRDKQFAELARTRLDAAWPSRWRPSAARPWPIMPGT